MRAGRAAAIRAAQQAVEATDPWLAAIRSAVADPAVPELVAQPIVDLTRADIIGYEILSRFPAPPQAPPNEWFANAERAGLGAFLEARVLRRTLELRRTLPPGTFVSVNISARHLGSEPVQSVLSGTDDLAGLVIELACPDAEAAAGLGSELTALSAAGGMLAIDEAGAGQVGLSQIATLRPALVKLDRSLVDGIHRDETKRTIVEMLAEYAGRVDSWLIAEGVETEADLKALARIGVPMAQGFLLGRPELPWPWLADDTIGMLHGVELGVSSSWHVAGLIEEADSIPVGDHEPPQTGQILVEVDPRGRPVAMRHAAGASPRRSAVPSLLTVLPSEGIDAVTRRAMARAAVYRFDPVICTDASGRLVGVVRVERLVESLADMAARAPREGDPPHVFAGHDGLLAQAGDQAARWPEHEAAEPAVAPVEPIDTLDPEPAWAAAAPTEARPLPSRRARAAGQRG